MRIRLGRAGGQDKGENQRHRCNFISKKHGGWLHTTLYSKKGPRASVAAPQQAASLSSSFAVAIGSAMTRPISYLLYYGSGGKVSGADSEPAPLVRKTSFYLMRDHCWLLLLPPLHMTRLEPLVVDPAPSKYKPFALFLNLT